MFTAGAKTTSLPFFLTSSPTTVACRKAFWGSNDAARDMGEGMPVAWPCRVPTGPSEK